jgi:uncharacterized protein (DUF488 family)
MSEILTIGYGNRDFPAFAALLHRYCVEVVCDVRSTPYSARYESFNREMLQQALRESGIKYLFLGDLLGARPSDPDLYVAGRASYEAMERSSIYRQGVERLEVGMETYRIGVMCAEKDPLDCHRAVLVSRMLVRDGVSVQHIGADGDIESHAALERRMLKKYGLVQQALFEPSSDSAALAEAYQRRGAELAYDLDAAYRARASS